MKITLPAPSTAMLRYLSRLAAWGAGNFFALPAIDI
jgi:hypothetical protein